MGFTTLKHLANAYYNYLKDRKSEYHATKRKTLAEIRKIYHDHGGVDGYRSMRVFLEGKNIRLSAATVHKYMNKELGLFAIVRSKKIKCQTGKPHKVFPNVIRQDFAAEEINQKWCTDFTYLSLTDGSIRYNCSILDLHDRSIVASITDKKITSDLVIRTLKKALESQETIKGDLILHSDQGSQYTSKEFTEFSAKKRGSYKA